MIKISNSDRSISLKLTLNSICRLFSLLLLNLYVWPAVSPSYGQVKWLSPVLTLNDGSRVQGMETRGKNDKAVTEFLGIPFAEPPVGKLRFRAPVAKKPWRHTWDATKLPKSCYQTSDNYLVNFKGAEMWNANTNKSEDCLYLNVWVPGRLDSSKRLSVMVWIFGGGFWSGTSTLDVYDGKILCAEENVIVVSMNYRVSVFGFLYLGRPEAPGNAGLLDQLEALKWVHENIRHFGGEPSEVTIFGESAGAASVSMHVLSPLSQPYFKRAIVESGTVFAPWALLSTETLLTRALWFSEGCHCNVTIRDVPPNFDKLIDCLLKVDAEAMLEREWVTFEFNDYPWAPVVDGHFLIEEPRQSMERGNFKRSELLAGTNYDEMMYFIIYHASTIFPKDYLFSRDDFLITDDLFEQAVKLLLPAKFKKNPIVKQAIMFEYRDWLLPGSASRRQQALDKMLGDYHFTCSVNEFAELYEEKGGAVYYYYFTHRASEQTWPAWMGVLHGYEIPFIFGEPLNTQDYRYTEEEKDLARRFMRYWANFARTGNPNNNPDGSWTADIWPAYTKDQRYITLTVNKSETGYGPRRRQCHFWREYIPKLFTATTSLTEMEVKWKQQFQKWEDEYITDWKHQFEQYVRLQRYRYWDNQCAGGDNDYR